MKLIIEMNLDNAEFECDPATAAGAILTRLAEDFMALGFDNVGQAAEDGARGTIMDSNGNSIGQWNLEGLTIEEPAKPEEPEKDYRTHLQDQMDPGNQNPVGAIQPKRLPADPEGENENRAQWAQAAVDAFMQATHTDKEDAICDLVCDLMHWADRNGMDFVRELNRATNHYTEETLED